MKAERLFQILGLVDESLIEEAVSASSPAAVQRVPVTFLGSSFEFSPPPLYSGGPHGFGFWPRPHVSR